MSTSLQPPLAPGPSSGVGIMGEVRHLLAAVSSHLLSLLKLAQMEADEAQKRIIRKIVFLAIAAVFFLGAYLSANAAGAFYLYELLEKWETALLALALGNLIVGLVFVIISICFSLSPLFKETLTELETDLSWITEKYNAKKNSDKR